MTRPYKPRVFKSPETRQRYIEGCKHGGKIEKIFTEEGKQRQRDALMRGNITQGKQVKTEIKSPY
jgi:hypothetical protein